MRNFGVSRTLKVLKTFRFQQLAHLAIYQFRKKIGCYDREQKKQPVSSQTRFVPLPVAANRDQLCSLLNANSDQILAQAEILLDNSFHPYSGPNCAPIDFTPLHPETHWSSLTAIYPQDIKDIWEPARFCWMAEVLRAAVLQDDPRYAAFFHEKLQLFCKQNPVGYGENWESAQEAAIRLIWITLSASILFPKGIPHLQKDETSLEQMIQDHAHRILQTRDYAIAQNNNHWLSEAAGLMTAACVLPGLPQAEKWFTQGWQDFQKALLQQIQPDGSYVQHSTNYHRLMLHLVLWVNFLLQNRKIQWPQKLIAAIRRTNRWLAKQVDPISGKTWQLGHNDGAHLFPLGEKFDDYRPTLNAVAAVFSGTMVFHDSEPVEMAVWMNCKPLSTSAESPADPGTPLDRTVLRLERENGWASLRATAYLDRPAHADQLHVSIWQGGQCLALDPGTFRYSAPSPWANSLKSAFVHNAPTFNGQEPMTDAGQFLWLDWDQARILETQEDQVTAEHFGFRHLGAHQSRTLIRTAKGWRIEDRFKPLFTSSESRKHDIRMNWLVPDADFEMTHDKDRYSVDFNSFAIHFHCDNATSEIQIIRAGKQLAAFPPSAKTDPKQEICGWVSSFYGSKQPALSIMIKATTTIPCTLHTEWVLQTSGGETKCASY